VDVLQNKRTVDYKIILNFVEKLMENRNEKKRPGKAQTLNFRVPVKGRIFKGHSWSKFVPCLFTIKV